MLADHLQYAGCQLTGAAHFDKFFGCFEGDGHGLEWAHKKARIVHFFPETGMCDGTSGQVTVSSPGDDGAMPRIRRYNAAPFLVGGCQECADHPSRCPLSNQLN